MTQASMGVDQLLVAMLRAELRRREAGFGTETAVAMAGGRDREATDLEALARTMLAVPSEPRPTAA